MTFGTASFCRCSSFFSFRRLSISLCPASAPSPSSRFRFSIVQLRRPAPRDVSHSGCAAENMPLRQIILHLSELNRHLSISVCIGGIVWESNPPSLARRPLRVLKTQEDTSHPTNPKLLVTDLYKFIPKKKSAQQRRLHIMVSSSAQA